ncbi:putative membrane protein [Bacillus mesophilus]|uniref:DUF2254 domain-containing protein n=1 Tax=Bacillus mesophilus TaxID=1808955 RepID=A0A6M0Q6G6_9BACI|nr:DUF2254 domain-containing protein [Bacillus mesophilus]MBM7659849.1 putative membrane protein [Bacillus mesophilus]NEY70708.1 DUF2254 domain-containing protein [Bacillus mesophilus]
MNFKKIWLLVRGSIWLIPFIYGTTSMILAVVSYYLDNYIAHHPHLYKHIPIIFLADIDLALTVLSSIATALLTMTTITFSSIMIVLTTFLSQFSPRTLQNFITDPPTQRVLGIFVGGFIYSVILLLLTRETEVHQLFIMPTLAVIYALVCLIFFVFFIHHVSKWIQVSNLIFDITTNALEIVKKHFIDKKDVHPDAPWEDWEYAEILQRKPIDVYPSHSGYLQTIDTKQLLHQAKLDNTIVRIEMRVGEFVDLDTPLLSIWKMEDKAINNDYMRFMSIGLERTTFQDIEFGLTKLVEIALRAVSPALNDPNTAINCISQIGKILAAIASKHLPKPFMNDDDRSLRIIMDQPNFAEYLYKAFYQIRHYGKDDISILASIIQSLTLIASKNDQDIKNEVWTFAQYIVEGINSEALLALDKNYINESLKQLAKKVGKREESLKLS